LFVVYGVIVTIAGISPSQATLDKAEGVNINLWTGIAMLLLGIFFLGWLKLRPYLRWKWRRSRRRKRGLRSSAGRGWAVAGRAHAAEPQMSQPRAP
jgi:hypothetical protein